MTKFYDHDFLNNTITNLIKLFITILCLLKISFFVNEIL